MNAYQEKRAARIERMKERAAKLERQSAQAMNRAHDMASIIPFGQPILVGHHSEGRDRRYRAKIHNTMGRAVALKKAAGEARARAYSAETNGAISSDDPEAIDLLKAKLANLENQQAVMVSVNKEARKQGIPKPHPTWQLSNNNANMKRIKERIERLEKLAKLESNEITIGTVRIFQNVEANRLQLFFPDKPSAEVRAKLKGYGFRWSPSEGAWQLQISSAAQWKAKEVAALYNGGEQP